MDNRLSEDAQLLSIYIGESDKWRGRPLYAAILETLRKEGVAGATVVRGVAGFGAHSHIHTASILRLSEDLPLCIQVVDKADKITDAINLVGPMVGEGMVTVEDVHVVKYTHRYLNPLPADKPVSEVMTRKVITLTDTMSVAAAWEQMLKHLLKGMPVLNSGGQLVGILTDEDLLERAGLEQSLSVAERLEESTLRAEFTALQKSPLKVADVMTTPVITVHAEEPLGTAAARMAEHGIKRLPVLDQSGKLIGVLSRVDVLRQVTSEEAKRRAAKAPSGAARSLGDIMLADVPTVPQDANLAEVISRFLQAESRRLIVVDHNGRPLGLISDADAVVRVQPGARGGVMQALRGKEIAPDEKITASELMSPGVLTALKDTTLTDAVHQMLSPQRKWLVVVDAGGKAIGLVDRQALFRALMHYR